MAAAAVENTKRYMAATSGRTAKQPFWIRNMMPPRSVHSLCILPGHGVASEASSWRRARARLPPQALPALRWEPLSLECHSTGCAVMLLWRTFMFRWRMEKFCQSCAWKNDYPNEADVRAQNEQVLAAGKPQIQLCERRSTAIMPRILPTQRSGTEGGSAMDASQGLTFVLYAIVAFFVIGTIL